VQAVELRHRLAERAGAEDHLERARAAAVVQRPHARGELPLRQARVEPGQSQLGCEGGALRAQGLLAALEGRETVVRGREARIKRVEAEDRRALLLLDRGGL